MKPSVAIKWSLVFFFILFITGFFALFYLVHKPWREINELKAVAKISLDLIVSFLLVTLAGGLGRQFWQDIKGVHVFERLALQFALGMGVLGTAWLALGVVGLLRPWISWLLLVVSIFLMRHSALAWIEEWRSLHIGFPLTGLSRFCFYFSILVIALQLPKALAPPLKWDSLAYHLAMPQRYVESGTVSPSFENIFGGFPQLVEMLYSLAITLGRLNTAAVITWWAGVVAFFGLEGWVRRQFGLNAAWLATAILLTGMSISNSMSWAYLDLWLLLFGWGIVISLLKFLETRTYDWLVMAGFSAGFAWSTKYTAGLYLFISAFLILLMGKSSIREWKEILRRLVIFIFVACLVFLPWLVKNCLFFRNPIYPASFPGFQSNPWLQVFHAEPASERNLLDDVLLPVDISLFGLEGGIVVGTPEYGANIGPLLIGLLPGLLVGWNAWKTDAKRNLEALLLGLGITWISWSIASHLAHELAYPRHYYGMFPALAFLSTAGYLALGSVDIKGVRIQRIVGGLVVLVLALSLLGEFLVFVDADPFPVLLGRQAEHEYLRQELGLYAESISAVNELPKSAQVYFLWEPRTLYCKVFCFSDGKLQNWLYLRKTYGDSVSIHQELKSRGYTHVLLYSTGMSWWKDKNKDYPQGDWDELEIFISTQLIQVRAFGGEYQLFELNP